MDISVYRTADEDGDLVREFTFSDSVLKIEERKILITNNDGNVVGVFSLDDFCACETPEDEHE